MKKKKLLPLLALACSISCVAGLASCTQGNGGSSKEPTKIEQVYGQYVINAKAAGETPLSYEEWLNTIKGEKGDPGENGAPGAPGENGEDGITPQLRVNETTKNWEVSYDEGATWEDLGVSAVGTPGENGQNGAPGTPGAPGENGVGIEKVELNADGDLVITLTDGSTQTVDMPASGTQTPPLEEHDFGEWTVYTTENVSCENRLFYRVCSDCSVIEWKKGTSDDHDFTTVTTPPTCQAGGYDTNTCGICGKVEITNEKPVADHAWAQTYSFDKTHHWFNCGTCTQEKDKQEHTAGEAGECTVCGELVGDTPGVLYEVVAGKARVVGYEGTATRVRLAETYENAPVTEICANAFNGSSIVSVLISDSVTSIGDAAFYGCSELTSVIIGDGVTSIGNSAFSGCDSLTSVEIPNSVESIGEDAFSRCFSLTSVNYTGTADGWAQIWFVNIRSNPLLYAENFYINNELVMEINLTTATKISSYAFSYCTNLKSVVIGNSVTSIGENAFRYCDNLTSVAIGDSVESIGDFAFEYCSKLMSIEIPDSVESIGASAFRYCDNLTSVVIGDSVAWIADYVFNNCANLTSVVIGDSVTSIAASAFASCDKLTFNKHGNANYLPSKTNPYFALISATNKNYSTYTIHQDTKIIATSAFEGCDNLTDVYYQGKADDWAQISFSNNYSNPLYYADNFYINNELVTEVNLTTATNVPDYAFYCCKNLTSVVLGDNVTSIGNSAFMCCDNLTSVVIGDSVEYIGSSAFQGCSKLTSVYYKGTASDWLNIEFGWYNEKLTSATRYYYIENEADVPTDGGNYWHYENGVPTAW